MADTLHAETEKHKSPLPRLGMRTFDYVRNKTPKGFPLNSRRWSEVRNVDERNLRLIDEQPTHRKALVLSDSLTMGLPLSRPSFLPDAVRRFPR